jgi:hypothetical protein
MRYVSRALVAGGLGLAAAFLASCGASSGLLSTSQSNALTANLHQASAAVSSGECGDADTAIANLQAQVVGLPPSVNSTLVSDLSRGIQTVEALASKDCRGGVLGDGSNTTTGPAATPTTTHEHTTSTPTTTTSTQGQTISTATQTPPTTPTTPATTPTSPGTTSTGNGGGAGLPGTGGVDGGPPINSSG